MKYSRSAVLFVIIYCLSGIGFSVQAGAFNHPEIKWQILETEHFKIFAYDGLMDVASDVADIAEEIFPWVTQDLGYVPAFKVPLMLIDYDAEVNGSAEPLFGKIVIYCSSGTKVTSGNLAWFRRVIAHEFSHVITFGALGAFEGLNQKYQALGALQVLPMWFLEGIAQWEGETWDTHRDMLLRMTATGGKLLPLSRLAGFAGTDIRESRLVYEQGHSLVRFIAATYGRDRIKEILEVLRKRPFNMDLAVKKVLNEDMDKLYKKWLAYTNSIYRKEADKRYPYYGFARRMTNTGGWMYHPVFSPDGEKIVYASSQDYDYAICDLYIAELKNNRMVNPKKIAQKVGYFHSFSPDGKSILYSCARNRVLNGSLSEDLYIMDLATLRFGKITENENARHPSFSPDGKKIAYVVNSKGVTDIWLMDADGSRKVNLTEGKNYEQNDSPQWSRDGRYLAFSHFSENKRDIALIDFESQKIIRLTDDEWDDRTPVFLKDGSGLIFTSDRGTGIPNLFVMTFNGDPACSYVKEIKRLTDVLGGVFEPCIDPSGEYIAFSGFGTRGFDIYLCGMDRLREYDIEDIDYSELALIRDNFYVEKTAADDTYAVPDTKSVALGADTGDHVLYRGETISLKSNMSFSRQGSQEVIHTEPQKSSVKEEAKIYPYNSFMNIRPIFILPALVISAEQGKLIGYGTLDLYFLDPLEKHTIRGYSYFDNNDAVYAIEYLNCQLYPTIYISINQNPFYYLGGYQWSRYRENVINFIFPLTAHHTVSFAGVFSGTENIMTDTGGYVISSDERWDNSLGVSLSYFTVKERVDMDFNPAGGRKIDVSYFWSDPSLGSRARYDLYGVDWREYIDLWREGGHTLALRSCGRILQGDGDYVLSLPWDNNTLRGIPAGSLKGSRSFACSAEYRLPVANNLNFNFLGLYFDKWYMVPFYDWGVTWYDNNIGNSSCRYSLGLEYRFRFWIMSRYQMLMRIGIVTTEIEDNTSSGGYFISVQPNF